jgi:hypothetical protein
MKEEFEIGDLVESVQDTIATPRSGKLFLVIGFDEDRDLFLFSFKSRDTVNDYTRHYEKVESLL